MGAPASARASATLLSISTTARRSSTVSTAACQWLFQSPCREASCSLPLPGTSRRSSAGRAPAPSSAETRSPGLRRRSSTWLASASETSMRSRGGRPSSPSRPASDSPRPSVRSNGIAAVVVASRLGGRTCAASNWGGARRRGIGCGAGSCDKEATARAASGTARTIRARVGRTRCHSVRGRSFPL